VIWRPVIGGLLLQFVFALIIIRTTWGYEAFNWLGARVTEFLDHTDAGSKFVFGDLYTNHFFAFKVRNGIGKQTHLKEYLANCSHINLSISLIASKLKTENGNRAKHTFSLGFINFYL
jgi:nucleoside permease NupC